MSKNLMSWKILKKFKKFLRALKAPIRATNQHCRSEKADLVSRRRVVTLASSRDRRELMWVHAGWQLGPRNATDDGRDGRMGTHADPPPATGGRVAQQFPAKLEIILMDQNDELCLLLVYSPMSFCAIR